MWTIWVPVIVSALTTMGAVYAAMANRRGQSQKVEADADATFRKDLLARVEQLERKVSELQDELYRERKTSVEKERAYNALLLEHEELKRKYEALKLEVEELRPLKAEVDKLREQVQRAEGSNGA